MSFRMQFACSIAEQGADRAHPELRHIYLMGAVPISAVTTFTIARGRRRARRVLMFRGRYRAVENINPTCAVSPLARNWACTIHREKTQAVPEHVAHSTMVARSHGRLVAAPRPRTPPVTAARLGGQWTVGRAASGGATAAAWGALSAGESGLGAAGESVASLAASRRRSLARCRQSR